MSASQMFVKLLAAHAQKQLPEGYSIALWFDSEGYSTQLFDPDETRIDRESLMDFAKLVEIAQADAARRAANGIQ